MRIVDCFTTYNVSLASSILAYIENRNKIEDTLILKVSISTREELKEVLDVEKNKYGGSFQTNNTSCNECGDFRQTHTHATNAVRTSDKDTFVQTHSYWVGL